MKAQSACSNQQPDGSHWANQRGKEMMTSSNSVSDWLTVTDNSGNSIRDWSVPTGCPRLGRFWKNGD